MPRLPQSLRKGEEMIYVQKRIEKPCRTCRKVEPMTRRTDLCCSCRIEAKRIYQLAYSHAHQEEIAAKNNAYYHANKVLKRPPKQAEPPPVEPIPWDAVESAMKTGICGRCGNGEARKTLLCAKCDPPQKERRKRLTPKTYSDIRTHFSRGMKYRKIADKLELPPSTVYKIIKQNRWKATA